MQHRRLCTLTSFTADAHVLIAEASRLLTFIADTFIVVQKLYDLLCLLSHCGRQRQSGRGSWESQSQLRTASALVNSSLEVIEVSEGADLVHVVASLLYKPLSAVLGEVLQQSQALSADV